MKTLPKLKINKLQTHVRFDNDWYEIIEDQDGDPYFIYYGDLNKPNGVALSFEVDEIISDCTETI